MSGIKADYSNLPFSRKTAIYASLGAISTVAWYFTVSTRIRNPILIIISALFLFFFVSSISWTMWELVIPVMGYEPPSR